MRLDAVHRDLRQHRLHIGRIQPQFAQAWERGEPAFRYSHLCATYTLEKAHLLCSRDSWRRWAIWPSLSSIAEAPLRSPLHDSTSPLILARLLSSTKGGLPSNNS